MNNLLTSLGQRKKGEETRTPIKIVNADGNTIIQCEENQGVYYYTLMGWFGLNANVHSLNDFGDWEGSDFSTNFEWRSMSRSRQEREQAYRTFVQMFVLPLDPALRRVESD